jgi:hypothetical protein
MFVVKWLLLAMDKDGRLMFWHTWCCRGVVLSNFDLFYLFCPSYQIARVGFVSPSNNKSP